MNTMTIITHNIYDQAKQLISQMDASNQMAITELVDYQKHVEEITILMDTLCIPREMNGQRLDFWQRVRIGLR